MRGYFDGEKLKKLRKSKGLTTNQVANKVNVSQSYISRFENNKAIPDIEMIARILDVLDTDIPTFFADNPELPPDLLKLTQTAKKLTTEEREKVTDLLETMLRRLEEGKKNED